MHAILQVAIGGAVGAVMRYLAVSGIVRAFGTGFPVGTVFVNLAGSFLMGLVVGWCGARVPAFWAMPLLTVGVLGGFTTFSAFSLETVALLENGRSAAATIYVLVSVTGSVAALAAGLALSRGGLA